jgi:hypothetical protein
MLFRCRERRDDALIGRVVEMAIDPPAGSGDGMFADEDVENACEEAPSTPWPDRPVHRA